MIDSPYAAVKLSDFRLLLIGRLFVTIAWQIQGVAVAWQIYARTKDPLFLGLAGLVQIVPKLGIALYAGHVVDVVDRRKVAFLSVCALLSTLVLLGICSTLVVDRLLLVTAIFSIIALGSIARSFYGPAVFGLTADIVSPELYGNATAWNTAVWQASAVAGPALGGVLYVCFAASLTYLIAAILALCSLFCFLFIKARTSIEKTAVSSVHKNISEGLKFVFSNEIVLGAMALDLFAVLFGGAVAVLPIFTSEIFHLGPRALGLLRAAPSIGALLIASLLTHRPITRNAGAVFLLSVAGFGLCMILFGLSVNFWLSVGLLAAGGALDAISIWIRTTIYQLTTPPNMKGRVAAVNGIFIGSSNEIGEFESGVAAKLMGLVPSVIFGGCMTLLVVLFTMFKAPKLRRLQMETLYKDI